MKSMYDGKTMQYWDFKNHVFKSWFSKENYWRPDIINTAE